MHVLCLCLAFFFLNFITVGKKESKTSPLSIKKLRKDQNYFNNIDFQIRESIYPLNVYKRPMTMHKTVQTERFKAALKYNGN